VNRKENRTEQKRTEEKDKYQPKFISHKQKAAYIPFSRKEHGIVTQLL